ncbi:MAG: PAS domain S-box protein [Candidatus Kapabacteria bacterium]|nr:PAS domain S-box protein [Candidatus Kapabacteria bacterium]
MNYQDKTKDELIIELERLQSEISKLKSISSSQSDEQVGDSAPSEGISDKYEYMFVHNPQPMWIFDIETLNFLEVNEAAINHYGYSREEFLSMTLKDIRPEEDIDLLIKKIEETRDTHNSSGGWRHLKKNGELIEVDIYAYTVSFHDKNARHVTINDITERSRAEEALRRTGKYYQTLIEKAPDGIVLVGLDGKINYASPSTLKIFGYEDNATLFPDPNESTHPDDLPYVLATIGEIFENPSKVSTIEYRFKNRDGSWNWIESTFTNQFAEPGIESLVINFRDISDRKKIEEALQKNIEIFSLFMELSPIYAFIKEVTPTSSRVLKASLNYVDMIGIQASEMVGKTMHELFPTELADKMTQDDWATVENGEVFQVDEEFNGRYYTSLKYPIKQGDKNLLAGYTIDITDRKKAENEITILAHALRSVNECISITDLEDNTIFVNESFLKTYGYDENELVGEKISVVRSSKNSEELVQEILPATLQGGWKGELWNRRKDGSEFLIQLSTTIIHDKDNKPFALIGVASDITEKKAAEEKFKENHELMRIAGEYAKLGGWSVNLENNLCYWSDIVAKIHEMPLGFSPSVEVGINFYAPEWREKIAESVKKCIEEGISYEEEMEIITSTGKRVWVKAIGVPVYDDKGRIFKIQGAFQDISNRKKAEELLIESELKHRLLIEQMQEGLLVVDNDDVIKFVNPMFCNIFGYEESELIGKIGYETLLLKSDKDLIIQKNLERQHGNPEQYELVMVKKNGEQIIVFMNAAPAFDKNGKVIGSMSTCKDITQSKKAEQELIKAKERAEESDRLKSAFLANMSHEIRTPMNGILGFAGLLKKPNLSGKEQMEFVEIIEKSGIRMLNIINDIVDISKIEAGLMEIRLAKTNINECLKEIYRFFKPEIESKGMKCDLFNSIEKQDAIIKTDKEKFMAILTNLVKNSIKYSHFGTIEIGCQFKDTPNNTELEFYVKDTGIGIPKERHEAIFDRFVQADIEDKHAFQGAGLGLSITKAYIEMLGGQIRVESELGKGSTFYFTLPYNPVNGSNKPIVKTIVEIPKKDEIANMKLLIVDDDATSFYLISRMMKKRAREILSADNAFDAVEICRQNPDIDIVLMDIKMPGLSGLEATQLIREFNKDVIIIAQTAYALAGDKERTLEAGCNDYIAKPILKSALMSIIQKHFTNKIMNLD